MKVETAYALTFLWIPCSLHIHGAWHIAGAQYMLVKKSMTK